MKIGELFPKVFEVPFTSDTKIHLSIHRKGHAQGGLTLHMKGAPEAVWASCTTIFINGKPEPITDGLRKRYEQASVEMCNKGQRVIAFAMLQMRGDKYPDNFRFNFEKQNYPTV